MTRTALPLVGFLLASTALVPFAAAQTTVSEDSSATQRTSDTGDLTVAPGVVLTPTTGSAIVVDSDDDVTLSGASGGTGAASIDIQDRNDATAIEVQGGNSGNILIGGTVRVDEDFTPEDSDDDGLPDGSFAQGSGRTGILISGAAPFVGNVTVAATGAVVVEGNDSFGVRLAQDTALTGDMTLAGTLSMVGADSAAVAVEGNVDGDVVTGGTITTRGEGTSAVVIAGDVTGRYENSSTITSTGYRFDQRPATFIRDLLTEEDLRQGGSAVQINGNVEGGVFFREVLDTTVNDDGSETTTLTARSSVTQSGSAPAILIDGNGTPISIGTVVRITDVDDPDFEDGLEYAFVNQGIMSATGVYDDVNATVFEAREATLEGGLSNTGTMSAFAFRSGDSGTEDQDGFQGVARVIVLGDEAIADSINNGGIISAAVAEAADVIFADRDAILPPRAITAVAIDIAATAEVAELTNSGTITAVLTGREGEAVVVRDASGTLSTIDNTGVISAIGVSSDTANGADTDFNLIALDLRNNTVGVTITQERGDLDIAPQIFGSVLLGSGDDVVRSTFGSILGDVAFGDGEDRLEIENTAYIGGITDSDNLLTLVVADSSLALTGGQPVEITQASFDGESTFRPSIDVAGGTASTLVASGDVTFEDGARVIPFLESFSTNGLTRFAIAQGGSLSVNGDLDTLGEGFSPFLFDTDYSVDAATNTLFVDLRVRDAGALGLDAAQSGALPAALAALGLNDDLAASILNIENGDSFNTAYNQLLPEIAGASRQFVLANVDGAVGAVGSHLDTARRSQEQPGGVWIQEFGYFADRDRAGLSEQYRGSGFGFTGGVDTALGPFHAVGFNLGFASTEIEDVIGADEPLDITTLQGGVYAGLEFGGLGIEAYGGAGYDSFESNRNIVIGDFLSAASGDWDGFHYNGSLRAGYDVGLGNAFGAALWARPTVSLDYLSLTENAYTEDGADGIALALDERTVDTGAVTAMLNFGAQFQGERTWIRPALRVGYRSEFGDDVLTTGAFRGSPTPFAIAGNPFPQEGLLLGFSVGAGSGYSSLSFDLDSDIRDGFVRHTGRIVVRLLF